MLKVAPAYELISPVITEYDLSHFEAEQTSSETLSFSLL